MNCKYLQTLDENSTLFLFTCQVHLRQHKDCTDVKNRTTMSMVCPQKHTGSRNFPSITTVSLSRDKCCFQWFSFKTVYSVLGMCLFLFWSTVQKLFICGYRLLYEIVSCTVLNESLLGFKLFRCLRGFKRKEQPCRCFLKSWQRCLLLDGNCNCWKVTER